MTPTRWNLTLTNVENPAQDQPASRNWRRTIERAGPILLIVFLIVLWEILTRALEIPKFLLPAPTDNTGWPPRLN